ncbi:ABC transporter substrate-binding protein [Hyalangium minutum]|uniref:Maltose/maltodextrin ABC transporter, substrate binding periplasmic protein MalE n=1 Tax=Hyalangium minutum TaxID=394096 RepID=A0A085WQV9_9BACT|nr:ABC transporter substrate-binding protein [Hyalangium minutum]KFE70072.1 Maltose/maltodextrin ABC transporter, substrate binding periplasmic protein MalE [Hyalangium minutum]
MKKVLAGLVAVVALATPGLARAEKLVIACGSVGKEADLCKQGAEAWAKKAGHTVELMSVPQDAGQQLAQFQQLLAAGSSDVDVIRIDVVWPGMVANHFVDLKPYFPDDVLKQHFQPIVQNNTVNGKLIAIPWFTDAGLLYYRKDLLEKYGQKPPTTWQELATSAQAVLDGEKKAGNTKLVGFVFQGKAYEGLTCNALEWIDSFKGGTIVDSSGQVTVNNPKAAEAIDFFAGLMGNVVPKGVLNYQEEEARNAFQAGNAVFMRNWPYAWALANSKDSPVAGKVGVMALPKGGADGKATGTLGGWQLGVSKYSKNAPLAAELVKYLTSAEEQKRRAIEGSFNPTIMSLYKDADLLKANPFMGNLYETFVNAVPRPTITGAKYNQVSTEFRNGVYSTLSGKGKAADNLKKVEAKLKTLGKNGKW